MSKDIHPGLRTLLGNISRDPEVAAKQGRAANAYIDPATGEQHVNSLDTVVTPIDGIEGFEQQPTGQASVAANGLAKVLPFRYRPGQQPPTNPPNPAA